MNSIEELQDKIDELWTTGRFTFFEDGMSNDFSDGLEDFLSENEDKLDTLEILLIEKINATGNLYFVNHYAIEYLSNIVDRQFGLKFCRELAMCALSRDVQKKARSRLKEMENE